ncbi:MAG TPA: hypothetical protein VEO74_11925, partial [Thermoanaerobaculia bacterium]|nr:hypothetical protein [Thermoanaerobaculia bacterium]
YTNIAARMRFIFADTTDEAVGPTVDDVRRLIRTAQSLAERSGREEEAMARVLAAREFAIPNRRMIALADELLAREGRLIAAVENALA